MISHPLLGQGRGGGREGGGGVVGAGLPSLLRSKCQENMLYQSMTLRGQCVITARGFVLQNKGFYPLVLCRLWVSAEQRCCNSFWPLKSRMYVYACVCTSV